MSTPRKYDVVAQAVERLIGTMHRPGLDRGMIASFGNTFRIDQDFTTDPSALRSAVSAVGRSVSNEQTRLYDSMADAAAAFYRSGRRHAVWLMLVISDGADNCSTRFAGNPVGAGLLLRATYNLDPTNYLAVIGVGSGSQIDRPALAALGQAAGCGAVHLDGFELVQGLFARLALQVTSRLVGVGYQAGGVSWAEIARVRELRTVPIDWCVLLDRSGSMSESASRAAATPTPAARPGVASWFQRN
jgi:hypothetical protein